MYSQQDLIQDDQSTRVINADEFLRKMETLDTKSKKEFFLKLKDITIRVGINCVESCVASFSAI